MPIIYSVVARGSVVLAEYSITSGNFTTIATRILGKIPLNDNKMSYVADRHIFHYIVEDGITYLCMADEEFGRRLPFAFLEDIKNRFKSTYADRGKTALAYGMNADFSRVLQNQMDYYSNNPNADRITRVRNEIDEVKTVMVQNIEKVLERGERIELLVDRTENLNQTAFQFKKKSTQVKRRMWWKNVKVMVILVVVVLVIVYAAVAVACGGFTLPTCRKIAGNIAGYTTTTTTTLTATTTTTTATSATTSTLTTTSTTAASTATTAATTTIASTTGTVSTSSIAAST
jgi:vesicle-associated membrane protein 7